MAALAAASCLLLAGIVVARPVHDWTAVTPAGAGRVAIDPGCSDFAGPSASLAIGGDGTAYMTGCGDKGGGRTAATFAVRADGTVAWYRREPADGTWAPSRAVVVDPNGGARIIGAARPAAQGLGVGLRAYAATGAALWMNFVSASVPSQTESFAAMAAAGGGNSYVAHAPSTPAADVALRQVDANGATSWQQAVSLAPAGQAQVRFVRIASNGDVLVAGDVRLGLAGADRRGFVASFTSAGAWRWSTLLPGPAGGAAMVQDFDVAADGGARVGLALRSGTSARLQLVGLGANGGIELTHDVVEVADDDFRDLPLRAHFALATGPAGGAYVVASGRRTSDGSLFRLLERLDASGASSWRLDESPPSLRTFQDVAVDAGGRAVVVGAGPDSLPQVMVVDVAGSVVWSRSGAPSVPAPLDRSIRMNDYFAVAITPDGRIVAAGLQIAGGQSRPALDAWSPTGSSLWQALAPPEDSMPGRLVDGSEPPESRFANDPAGGWYVLTRTRIGDGPVVMLTRFGQSGARLWTQAVGEAADEFERPMGVSVVEGEPVLVSTRYHGNSFALTLRRYRADGSLRWRRDPNPGFSFQPGLLRQVATANGIAVLAADDFDPAGPRVHVMRFDSMGNLVASGASTTTGATLGDVAMDARGDRVVAVYGGRSASGSDICVAFEIDPGGALSWTWRDDAPGPSRYCARIAIAGDGATWITGQLDGKPRAVRLTTGGTPAWTLVDVDAPTPDAWQQIAFIDGGDAVVSSGFGVSRLTRISASGASGWRQEEAGCDHASRLAVDAAGRIISVCAIGTTGRGLLRRRDAAGNLIDTMPITGLAPAAVRIDAGGAIGVAGLSAPATEDQRVALARFAIDADAVFGDGYE